MQTCERSSRSCRAEVLQSETPHFLAAHSHPRHVQFTHSRNEGSGAPGNAGLAKPSGGGEPPCTPRMVCETIRGGVRRFLAIGSARLPALHWRLLFDPGPRFLHRAS